MLSHQDTHLATVIENHLQFATDARTIARNILTKSTVPSEGAAALSPLLVQTVKVLGYLHTPTTLQSEQAQEITQLLREVKDSQPDLLAPAPSSSPSLAAYINTPTLSDKASLFASLDGIPLLDNLRADFNIALLEIEKWLPLAQEPRHVKEYIEKLKTQLKIGLQILRKPDQITDQQAKKLKSLWECATQTDLNGYFIKKMKEMEKMEQLKLSIILSHDDKQHSQHSILPVIPDPLQFIPEPPEEEEKKLDALECSLSGQLFFWPVMTGIPGDQRYEKSFIEESLAFGNTYSPHIRTEKINLKKLTFCESTADAVVELLKHDPRLVHHRHVPITETVSAISKNNSILIQSYLQYDVCYQLLADKDLITAVNSCNNNTIKQLFRDHFAKQQVERQDYMLECIKSNQVVVVKALLEHDHLNTTRYLTELTFKTALVKASAAMNHVFKEAWLRVYETPMPRVMEGAWKREYENKQSDPAPLSEKNWQIALKSLLEHGTPARMTAPEEDSFFAAIAQALQQAKITIPISGNAPDSQKLRQLCHQFAVENPEFAKTKLRLDGEDYESYLGQIEYSATSAKEAYQSGKTERPLAISGREAIEGAFICKALNINLHVVKIDPSAATYTHHLVDSTSTRKIEETLFSEEIYSSPRTLQLVNQANSPTYWSFITKPRSQKNESTLPPADSIEMKSAEPVLPVKKKSKHKRKKRKKKKLSEKSKIADKDQAQPLIAENQPATIAPLETKVASPQALETKPVASVPIETKSVPAQPDEKKQPQEKIPLPKHLQNNQSVLKLQIVRRNLLDRLIPAAFSRDTIQIEWALLLDQVNQALATALLSQEDGDWTTQNQTLLATIAASDADLLQEVTAVTLVRSVFKVIQADADHISSLINDWLDSGLADEPRLVEYLNKLKTQLTILQRLLLTLERVNESHAKKIITLWKCAIREDVIHFFDHKRTLNMASNSNENASLLPSETPASSGRREAKHIVPQRTQQDNSLFSTAFDSKAANTSKNVITVITNPLKLLPEPEDKQLASINQHYLCPLTNMILFRPVSYAGDSTFYEEGKKDCSASAVFNHIHANDIRSFLEKNPHLIAVQYLPVTEMLVAISTLEGTGTTILAEKRRADLRDKIRNMLSLDLQFRFLASNRIVNVVNQCADPQIKKYFTDHQTAYQRHQVQAMLRAIKERDISLLAGLLTHDHFNLDTYLTHSEIAAAVEKATPAVKMAFQQAKKHRDTILEEDLDDSTMDFSSDFSSSEAPKNISELKEPDPAAISSCIHDALKDYGEIKTVSTSWTSDRFFKTLAQGLVLAKLSIPGDEQQSGLKKLRMLCQKYAKDYSASCKAIMECSDDTLNKYIHDIQFTAKEINEERRAKRTKRIAPIGGQLATDGVFICRALGIKIHAIDWQVVNSKTVPMHHIIDSYGMRSVDHDYFDVNSYADPKTIHLVGKERNFDLCIPHALLSCKTTATPEEKSIPVLALQSLTLSSSSSSSSAQSDSSSSQAIEIEQPMVKSHFAGTMTLFPTPPQQDGEKAPEVSQNRTIAISKPKPEDPKNKLL